jgi:hypothetical protein
MKAYTLIKSVFNQRLIVPPCTVLVNFPMNIKNTYILYTVGIFKQQGRAVNRGLKHFFSMYSIGPHVLLKLILGLKSTVLCGLDPWLTIHSILTSFFLATA